MRVDKQSYKGARALFTEIGCIMEDASVIALVWDDPNPMSAQDRYQTLSRAHHKINSVLEKIKAAIEGA